MERLIGVMLLCTVLALVHGSCYRGNLDFATSPGSRRMCLDTIDNKAYRIGTRWQNSQCHQCACTPMGLSCCESFNPCA